LQLRFVDKFLIADDTVRAVVLFVDIDGAICSGMPVRKASSGRSSAAVLSKRRLSVLGVGSIARNTCAQHDPVWRSPMIRAGR
jgi:hypothetical protein